VHACGSAGYLHIIRERDDRGERDYWSPPVRRVTIPAPPPDLGSLAQVCREAVDPKRLERLARSLGLTLASLRRLGIGWRAESNAWSFPMTEASGRVIGIRLRKDSGFKFAVTGGRDGIFVPYGIGTGRPLLICEGVTDCVALLDLGFDVIGRASCTSSHKLVADIIDRRQDSEAIIVADNDPHGRGQGGANALAQKLVIHCRRVRVITPPEKDARAWMQAGATARDVLDAIRSAPVHRLSVRTVGSMVTASAGEVRHAG